MYYSNSYTICEPKELSVTKGTGSMLRLITLFLLIDECVCVCVYIARIS